MVRIRFWKYLIYYFPGGWFSRRLAHHQLHSRESHRLHETVHEPGHQYSLPPARQERSGIVLVLVAIVALRLVLYGGGLSAGQLHAFHLGALHPLRVVQPLSLQTRLGHRGEPVYYHEQFMVHHWIAHATRWVARVFEHKDLGFVPRPRRIISWLKFLLTNLWRACARPDVDE